MAIDHGGDVWRQFELKMPFVFHLVFSEDQEQSAVSRPLQVPLEMDFCEVLDANGADKKDGNSDCDLAIKRSEEGLAAARGPLEQAFRKEKQAPLIFLVLKHTKAVAILPRHARLWL
jgi:hypothetical protein